MFHCFLYVFENKIAVAAAALVGEPPNCSHRNCIFENVVKPVVLATFFVDVDAAMGGEHRDWHLLSVRTPQSKALFGEFAKDHFQECLWG